MACARIVKNPVVARLLGLLVAALFICHYAKITDMTRTSMSKRRINGQVGQRDRPYNFMLVQQVEYLKPPYNSLDKLLVRLEEIGSERYAGILHDKDSGEKPHIHIFMHFPHGREIKSVAKKLNIAPQYIEKWDGSSDNGFAYLVHQTPKASNDYQYSPSEVVANFDYVGWLGEYAAKKREKVKSIYGSNDINHLLDCLYTGAITREDVEKQLSGSQYAKHHKKIDDVCAKRMQDVAKQRNAERKAKGEKIKVIWIFGPAGTGKTRFAKEQAAKQDEHYYITGSSRDPFQRYNCEDVIIYDEARPGDIAFSDLLKLLDPYGEDVAAPSRYYDKAICAGTFYITSPYSPLDYYKKFMGDNWGLQTDKYEQLLRRLSLVIQITEESIRAVRYDTQKKKFFPIPETTRPNIYWQEAKKNKDESILLFNSFFDDADTSTPKGEEPHEQMRISE